MAEQSIDISFIVPVYNVEQYLPACISSIQDQGKQNIEIICVNDGSTDNSRAILEALATDDARLIILDQKNAGVSSARNLGIAHATGRYIAFVDADDWLEPDYARTLFDLAENNAADIVVFDGNVVPSVAWVERVVATTNGIFRGEGADALLHEQGCLPLMWDKFYRRALISEHNILLDEEVALGEDLLFQFATFPYAETIVFSDAKLYNYRTGRQDSAMSSSTDKRLQLQKHQDLLERIVALWSDYGCLSGREADILAATRFLFLDIFLLDLHNFRSAAKELLQQVKRLFGEWFLETLSKPEPHYFYSIISRAAAEHIGPFAYLKLKTDIFRNLRYM